MVWLATLILPGRQNKVMPRPASLVLVCRPGHVFFPLPGFFLAFICLPSGGTFGCALPPLLALCRWNGAFSALSLLFCSHSRAQWRLACLPQPACANARHGIHARACGLSSAGVVLGGAAHAGCRRRSEHAANAAHSVDEGVHFVFRVVQGERRTHRSEYAQTVHQGLCAVVTRAHGNA